MRRFCADIKYMMGIELGCYWRICWAYVTPGLMTAVLLYTLLDMSALTYKGVAYPPMAHSKHGALTEAASVEVEVDSAC